MGAESIVRTKLTNIIHIDIMKKFIALLIIVSCVLVAQAQNGSYTPTLENLKARSEFRDSRFGIFLHWGLYSVFGQGEWYMTNANINHAEYAKVSEAFYPHRFDAAQWVAAIKASGARYICFTSRHHEGFSMWDTKQSDYNIMNTPYGKDVLRMLADECHRQDVKLHLYYSHLDWTREDYPIGRTGRGTGREGRANWAEYYDFMNRQLTELLTNYGEIGAIWFDGVWDHDSDSVPFDWQLEEQYALIHRLQPACLVGNNHHQTPVEGEDIQIFERDVPGENKAGLSGQEISRLPLETCQTMNGMWGYKVVDQNYKSTAALIRLLVRTSAKGANLLLNVGPQPDGTLPATALSRLSEMGNWLAVNGSSIYGTEAGEVVVGDSIVSTQCGNVTYLHVLSDKVKRIEVPLTGKVKSVVAFSDKQRMEYRWRDGKLCIPEINIPEGTIDYIIEIHKK